MENLSNNGIHHIDGTYRITTHGFPLIVYGISDQVGRFHPVSFMITSHETKEDFDLFYAGLIELAEIFDIEYDPEYIMQDACDASLNSIKEFFPEVIPLMCFFHVKKNVKDNIAADNMLPKEKRDELLKDFTVIHMSHNSEDYANNLKTFKHKYYKHHRACYDYCATWFTGKWSNWQIYHNKPGQANTNSNIESFNNIIKKKYTNRTKLSMKAALVALEKLVLSYSTEPLDFEIYPKFEMKTKAYADKLVKKNFKKVGQNKYQYASLTTETAYIITTNNPQCHNMCSCTCKTFVKSGVCMHVVALSNLFGLQLFHPKYAGQKKSETFVTKVKRGRKSKKGFGKALDKPKLTSQPDTSTPNNSPTRVVEPPAKKARKEKSTGPVRASARLNKK